MTGITGDRAAWLHCCLVIGLTVARVTEEGCQGFLVILLTGDKAGWLHCCLVTGITGDKDDWL